MSMCFFIQNFQTHYCTYSGEDHVPVGVLLFSMRARGPRGWREGKSSPHSLPFSPTPLGELACMLFTTVLALVFITVIVSTHFCVICNYRYFSCLIISRPCCLSEFFPNSTSSSCGRDDEIDPSSRGSTDRRLKCTLFYFAGA